MRKRYRYIVCFLMHLASSSVYAACPEKPCKSLLDILNRPSDADSACVVPNKKLVIESGFNYYELIGGGNAQLFPLAELRFGLPQDNELVVILPSYVHQSVSPISGWTATVVGVKHMVGYTKKIIFSISTLVILPSGNDDFGSAGFGDETNVILAINLSSTVGVTIQMGLSSSTLPQGEGGDRYNSFNPNVVLAWKPKDKLQLYGEVYGASNTGPGEGAGYNFDGGVQFLICKNFVVDVEYGQRLIGRLFNFNHYIGFGMSFMLS